MSNPEFLRKLNSIYQDRDSVTHDIFGKRAALPSEIANQLRLNRSEDFRVLEPHYPPQQEDIQRKEQEEY